MFEVEKLNAKPVRKNRLEAEIEETKKRAYEQSYKAAAKEIAKVEGAAAGIAAAKGEAAPQREAAVSESPVEAARKRAIEATQPAVKAPVAKPKKKELSGQIITLENGKRVPIEYYDLSPEDAKNFLALIDEEEDKEKGATLFDQTAKALLDQLQLQSSRMQILEKQFYDALSIIDALKREVRSIGDSTRVEKSDALQHQHVELASMVVNLTGVGAEQQRLHDQRMSEYGALTTDFDNRANALNERVEGIENRTKNNGEMLQMKADAVDSSVVQLEKRIRGLTETVIDLEGRSNAIGNPITRVEMERLVSSAVTTEFPKQLPEMVSKELSIQKATGELGEGMEIDRAYLEQSLKNSDEQRKSRVLTQKQIDDAVFVDQTKIDVERATKKARRS